MRRRAGLAALFAFVRPGIDQRLQQLGLSTTMAPCSSRTQSRAAQARSCLLMLSRVMPTISLISCWVIATVRPRGSSFCFSVRRSNALASRPGRFCRMTCSTWSHVPRSRVHNSSRLHREKARE